MGGTALLGIQKPVIKAHGSSDAVSYTHLRNIPAPPLILYLRGKLCHFDEEAAIAMAGTRHASPYGKQMAREIAYEITIQGGLVVTGIVGGCDFSAATGALRAGGPVVCVTAVSYTHLDVYKRQA